jgi:sporulation protein YtfJ
MAVESLIKALMEEFRQISKTETVIGDPITVGSVTIIPVSKISFGFGAGGGRQDEGKTAGGSGTGGGATIEPIAFLVIRDEHVQVHSVTKKDVSLSSIIDVIPDVVHKIKGLKEKLEGKKVKETKESDPD